MCSRNIKNELGDVILWATPTSLQFVPYSNIALYINVISLQAQLGHIGRVIVTLYYKSIETFDNHFHRVHTIIMKTQN